MPTFGKTSRNRLDTCHTDLQLILEEAIKYVDFSILCGHRNKKDQNRYYNSKPQRSKVEYPNSKRNTSPSLAVDIAPYPIDWNNINRFRALVFFIKGIAITKGINIRLGIDWNGDFINNEKFVDAPHIELVM